MYNDRATLLRRYLIHYMKELRKPDRSRSTSHSTFLAIVICTNFYAAVEVCFAPDPCTTKLPHMRLPMGSIQSTPSVFGNCEDLCSCLFTLAAQVVICSEAHHIG
mmetsp:Transcript_33873/g.55955  ORF Transcript_33873/g.55955 Transcript_33873/m.55955 type:complete len:105 (+) Transcript_33873:155-469(+)